MVSQPRSCCGGSRAQTVMKYGYNCTKLLSLKRASTDIDNTNYGHASIQDINSENKVEDKKHKLFWPLDLMNYIYASSRGAGLCAETARIKVFRGATINQLVIEDNFTKFIEIFPNMEAKTVAEMMLKGWIKRYGCPLELHSDQGRQYESQLFQSICKFLEIDKTRTTPGHPRSAGLEERSNRTIKDMISKFVRTDQRDWDRWIDFVAMAYYSTPHQSTAISAFRLIFGEEMRMLLDVILAEELNENELVSEHDHVMKIQDKLKTAHGIARVSLGTETKRQKRQYDKNVKRMDYSEGDLVRRYH
ncbi:unnamed protein product [Mytilus edulis]|uniref:Integrase catalytic domain-containing protein n=1 Tax=Mytilus edulis TaxID=6550 RepID=A0A8S3QP50_MYTED|nr:unnamed protein product [Mytilus edulis]